MAAIPVKSWICTLLSHLSFFNPAWIPAGNKGRAVAQRNHSHTLWPEPPKTGQLWGSHLITAAHICVKKLAPASSLVQAQITVYAEIVSFFLLIFTVESSTLNRWESGVARCRREFLFSACRETLKQICLWVILIVGLEKRIYSKWHLSFKALATWKLKSINF